MVKPFFDVVTVPESSSRQLPPCNAVRFRSVSGTVTAMFNDGGEVPVSSGDEFSTDSLGLFGKVKVICAAGASAVVVFGIGRSKSISAGGLSGSGSPQNVVAAGPGVTYLDLGTGQFWVKLSGVDTSGWLQLVF